MLPKKGEEEGGMINEMLTKRVLPITLALTAAGYLDYKTGHHVSNFAVSLPLRANILRADLTDDIPGARRVTDFYQQTVPGPQYGPLAHTRVHARAEPESASREREA